MSRSLTSPTVAAAAAAVTRPGYLVQINFASILRLSSRGDQTWASQTWASRNLRISGCGIDSSQSAQSGSIELGNTDYVVGALVLAEGVADRPISIWKYYADAIAADDPVLVFSGVCDSAEINPDAGTVTIALQQESNRTLYCPRGYITEENGFSFLPPSGTKISWNGTPYTLQEETE